MPNLFEQIGALAKLPGAIIGMQNSKNQLYNVNKQLKAAQNRKNKSYGLKPYGMPSYKNGGKVKQTGPALLHKGERVLNKKQAAKFDKKKVARAAHKSFKPY